MPKQKSRISSTYLYYTTPTCNIAESRLALSGAPWALHARRARGIFLSQSGTEASLAVDLGACLRHTNMVGT